VDLSGIDALTMGAVVRRSAERYPDRIALMFNDERCTFRQYNERVNRAAHTLGALGMQKGDHVAILGKNSIQYLELCHGAAKAGVVFGTINWRLSADEIAFIVKDADNKVLFVEHGFEDLLAKFRDQIPDIDVVIYGGDSVAPDAKQYEDLTRRASAQEPEVDVNGADDAIIMYTSGTTGLPKGAVLSHSNIVWDSVAALTYLPPLQHDCFLLSMPMNHVSGLHTHTTTYLARGLPMVVMRQWEPEQACRLIEKHRVTQAYILVAPLIQLLDSPVWKTYDLTSLRRILTAAAKYSSEIVSRALNQLGVDSMYFCYGLTEAAPLVTTTEYTADMIVKPNTLGKPVWYNDVRIVDDAGAPLPTGEIGEIIVRGPNVFKGYYKRPDANRQVLRNGWLYTGDLGYCDEDGFYFFVDRKKDMIKSGGENVYSIEVEMAVMKANPEVREVAIVGVPDPKWGEAVTAFVVFQDGQDVPQDTLVARTREILAGYKLPRNVVVCGDLPKNVSGKVLKRQLREQFEQTKRGDAK